MGWFGKALGGVIGFAVGGPIGAAVGATLGHGFDKENKKEVICPYCHKGVIIDGYGNWTCPHCNEVFSYLDQSSNNSGNNYSNSNNSNNRINQNNHNRSEFMKQNNNNNQSSAGNGNNIDVTCPYCNNSVLIGGYGRWICPHCKETFTYDGNEYDDEDNYEYENNNQQDLPAICYMYAMFEKLSKADGVISQKEISTITNFAKHTLELDSDDIKMGIEAFRKAKESSDSFEYYALKFYEAMKLQFDRNESSEPFFAGILDALFQIAAADMPICPEQDRMLNMAGSIFSLNPSIINAIKEQYVQATSNMDKYYNVLGCTKNDSMEEIQRKYKKLVMEYHPDKIMSKDLPQDFIKFATTRFQEIQEAYSIIKERHNK